MTKEDVVSTSDFDAGNDGSEHCDSVSNQLKQIDYEDEFGDAELEELVRLEGPQEILQLILQDSEQNRRAMCECTHGAAMTLLLQQPSLRDTSSIPTLLQAVQMKDGDYDRNTIELLGSSSHEELDTRWREICQRIRIDNSLDERGQ
ncbi:unnamed protein product [Sphagnum tenellum]